MFKPSEIADLLTNVRDMHFRQCLDLITSQFVSASETQQRTHFVQRRSPAAERAAWLTDYNTQRPHSQIGWLTPAEFAVANARSMQRPSGAALVEGSAPMAVAPTARWAQI